MTIIWNDSIIAVFCDYYNGPGECSWRYEPCGTVTTKTCRDRVIGQKFSAVLEGKVYFSNILKVVQIISIFYNWKMLFISANSELHFVIWWIGISIDYDINICTLETFYPDINYLFNKTDGGGEHSGRIPFQFLYLWLRM